MQEANKTWVQSLGGEDLLEEGMATHSRILDFRIPWTEEPGGLQFTGSQRVKHNQSDVAYIHRSEEEPNMFFSFLNAQPSLETL